jgi:hypothetical protein
VFIQTAMPRGGDVQSVVSAPPAINQQEGSPFSWMACGIGFHQVQDEMREWVLLDTASTVSMFCNADMVSNIRKEPRELQVQTNEAIFKSNMKADLPWCKSLV